VSKWDFSELVCHLLVTATVVVKVCIYSVQLQTCPTPFSSLQNVPQLIENIAGDLS